MAQNADFEPENCLSPELETELFLGDGGSVFPGADAAETSSPGSAASPQTPSLEVSQQGHADSQPAQSVAPRPAEKVTGGLALPAHALPKPPPPPPPPPRVVARDSMSPAGSSYGLGMLDEQPADGFVNPADLSLNRPSNVPVRNAPTPAAPAAPAAEIAQHDPPLLGGSFEEMESIVSLPLGFPAPAPAAPQAPENVPAAAPPAQPAPRCRARAPTPAPPPLPPPNYALQLGNRALVPDAISADVSAGRWGRWDPKKLCQGHYILRERAPYDRSCPRDVFAYMGATHFAAHHAWPGKTHGPTMAAAEWFEKAQVELRDAIAAKSVQHGGLLRQGWFPGWMVQWGINGTLWELNDANLLCREYAMVVVDRSFDMLDLFMEVEVGISGNGTEQAPYPVPE